MASPLSEYNVQQHSNSQLSTTQNEIESIHFYKFDQTLFKTPLPNPLIFHPDTIRILTNHDKDPLSNLNWFANPQIILKMENDIDTTNTDANTVPWLDYWNESLVSLVKLSSQQKNTLSVLISTRVPEMFEDIIPQLCGVKNLVFDSIILNEQNDYLDELVIKCINYYPSLNEITYYSNKTERELANDDLFTSVDFFKIQVPSQQSFLKPDVEIKLVSEMVHNYKRNNNKLKEDIGIRESTYYSYYALMPSSRQKLISIFKDDKYIPLKYQTSNNLKFDCEGIHIAKSRLSNSKLTLLGGTGKKVKLGTQSFGFIDERVYAIRVLINDENALSYFDYPTIVVAKADDVSLEEVRQITNWETTDVMIDLDAIVSLKETLKIYGL